MARLVRQYSSNERKNKIGWAVAKWKKFCRDADFFSQEERIERLNKLIDSNEENQFVEVFAMLESFPTLLMHHALWYYNIDFMSKESFLDRLSVEEYNAIAITYESIFEKAEMPECMTAGFKNKFKRLFGVLPKNLESLFETGFDDYKGYSRNIRKGKLGYEFFNSDFGFSKYLNVESDEVIAPLMWTGGKTPSVFQMAIFMSNDVYQKSDFIVNRMSGLYNWMYILSRSNICFWNEGRKIVSKSHPCSEIWLTWFLWLLAIIFSPILAVSGIARVIYNKFTSDETKSFAEDLMPVVLSISLVIAWLGISVISYYFFFETMALAVYTAIYLVIYIVYMYHKDLLLDKGLAPWKVPYLGVPMLVFVLGTAFKWAYPALQIIFSAIYLFLTENITIIAMLLGAVVSYFLLGFLMYFSVKKISESLAKLEDKYLDKSSYYMGEFVYYSFMVFSVISALFFVCAVLITILTLGSVESMGALLLATLLLVTIALGFKNLTWRNPRSVWRDKKSVIYADDIFPDILNRWFSGAVYDNKFFNLDDQKQKKEVCQIFQSQYLRNIVSNSLDAYDLAKILRRINKNNWHVFVNFVNLASQDKSLETKIIDRVKLLDYFDSGFVYEDAKSAIVHPKPVVEKTGYNFPNPLRGIKKVWSGIINFLGQIKLWRTITQMQCPGAVDKVFD